MTFEAMGELEYYVISEADPLFPANDQKGYHESEPFAKMNDFRRACMVHVAKTGGQIKYGHSEVGNFTGSWTQETATRASAEQTRVSFFISLSSIKRAKLPAETIHFY